MSKNSLTISIGTRQIKLHSRVMIFLVICLIFLVGYFTIQKIKGEIINLTQNSLEATLKANSESLLQWLKSKEDEIKIIASSPELINLSTLIADKHNRDSTKNILTSDLYLDLDERLRKSLSNSDFEDYFLVDSNNKIIASSHPEIVGDTLKTSGLKSDFLKQDFHLTLPERSNFNYKEKDAIYMTLSKKLKSSKPLYLALRLHPGQSFSRVLQVSRPGNTGETYALNKKGLMISNSRFIKELKEIKLLEPGDKNSVLKITCKTPVGKLTKMAESSLSGNKGISYPNIQSNLKGYLDYRGEEVIGAWTYIEKYGFAIATEIDKKEGYQSLNIIEWNFRGVLGLTVLFGIGVVFYSRKNIKLRREVQDAIKDAKELGQYVLKEKLGEGGMGIVYKSQHKMMQRETALKLLKNDVCNDRDIRLFENEVNLTCQLTHPNTISIYDYGKTDDGAFYYVMEYLDGIDLDKIIKLYGPLPAPRVIYFLVQICRSLSEAHSAGLVHRDIKGQNIIICKIGGEYDVVKVLDFGLVKEMADDQNSMLEAISGTPKFMSPEAISEPVKVNHLTDIYAIGILGYYLLTGKYPYDGNSPIATCMMHVTNEVKRPSSEATENYIPLDLENILMKCMSKDMSLRPQSTSILRTLLETCEEFEKWTSKDAEKWWTGTPLKSNDLKTSNSVDMTIHKTVILS